MVAGAHREECDVTGDGSEGRSRRALAAGATGLEIDLCANDAADLPWCAAHDCATPPEEPATSDVSARMLYDLTSDDYRKDKPTLGGPGYADLSSRLTAADADGLPLEGVGFRGDAVTAVKVFGRAAVLVRTMREMGLKECEAVLGAADGMIAGNHDFGRDPDDPETLRSVTKPGGGPAGAGRSPVVPRVIGPAVERADGCGGPGSPHPPRRSPHRTTIHPSKIPPTHNP